MRLTDLGNRATLAAALLLAAVFSTGCQRLPYIDQTKPVPHDSMSRIAEEDKEVRAATFMSTQPEPLPKVTKPRTTEDPEAEEIWYLTLEEAIRIGFDNAEFVRVIPFGGQGTPIGGFEPQKTSPGFSGQGGGGGFTTVYDPAILETRIAEALSQFDATFTTSMFWGRSENPFNNAIQAGTFAAGPRFPIVFNQDTAQFQSGIQKRTALGGTVGVQHNINYLYTNSPGNVTPGAYTTNTQLRFSQPLLGATQDGPSGLEANRARIIIARIDADTTVWGFKNNVIELARSIEQQYWNLSQQQILLWSRETAVKLGEEIVRKQEALLDAGRGTTADVAEARQQLERFELSYITATSDVINSERQLRNLLGLPPADSRRIVPATAPTEARVEPDWETSLAQMLAYHPDIVQQQLTVRRFELRLLLARNQLLPQLNLDLLYQFNGLGRTLDRAESVMAGDPILAIDPIIAQRQRDAGLNTNPGLYRNFQQWQFGLTYSAPIGFRGPLANVRFEQYELLKQRAVMRQIVHQQTNQLARFFLEVDANFKQFKTAQRLRAAAQQRLEAQRAYYEEGRFAIDRMLDAVSQYADAVAQEAQFRATYNISIAVLEETKGTLLAYNNIAVSEGPSPRKAYVQARDQIEAHRRIEGANDVDYKPRPVGGPDLPDPVPPSPSQGAGSEPKPFLPAPAGPLGDPPFPAPPAAPAGEPPQVSNRPRMDSPAASPVEPEVRPTSGESLEPPLPAGSEPLRDIPIDLPPLPNLE